MTKRRLSIGVLLMLLVLLYAGGLLAIYKQGLSKGYKCGYSNGWIRGRDTTDYPLLNIYFFRNERWLIVNHRFSTESAKEKIDVIDMPASTQPPGPHDVQYVAKNLSVTAIPVGLERTPDGQICVYKHGRLVKHVRYIGNPALTDPALRRMFKEITKKQAKALIGRALPSRI